MIISAIGRRRLPGWQIRPDSRMKERPSFPARLDFSIGKPKLERPVPGYAQSGLVPAAKPIYKVLTHGVGLEFSAPRMNMVHKLADQGITDPMVL